MSLLKYASYKLILSEDDVCTEFRVEAGAADGGAANTATQQQNSVQSNGWHYTTDFSV